jgi:hypothetical protein
LFCPEISFHALSWSFFLSLELLNPEKIVAVRSGKVEGDILHWRATECTAKSVISASRFRKWHERNIKNIS